jgi:hypothetical protein
MKKCECGKEMIKRYTDVVRLVYPSEHQWYWWCGCGRTEQGGWEREMTEEDLAMAEWEVINATERAAGVMRER